MIKRTVLQLPMESEGVYKNINLIIPNGNKEIDKNNMVFYFNLNTENLGDVKVHLKVIGKQVYTEFEVEKDDTILENKELLEKGLSKIGYTLENLIINT